MIISPKYCCSILSRADRADFNEIPHNVILPKYPLMGFPVYKGFCLFILERADKENLLFELSRHMCVCLFVWML